MIESLNTASGQLKERQQVSTLGFLSKDGTPVAITGSFLAAGAVGSDRPSVGVSAADGTLLMVQKQSVVSQAFVMTMWVLPSCLLRFACELMQAHQ